MKRFLSRLLIVLLALLQPGVALAAGTYLGSGGGGVIVTTAANLPATGDPTKTYRVTTATNGLDCDRVDSGTARAECRWNPLTTAYEPTGAAATGLTNPVVSDLNLARHDVIDPYGIGAAIYYCSTEAECEAAEARCPDTIGGLAPAGCIIQHTGGKIVTSTGINFSGSGSSVDGHVGFIFRGAGGGNPNEGEDSGSLIQMTGANPAVTLGACFGCSLLDFSIDGTGVATAGIKILDNSGSPTKVDIHGVGIYSINGFAIDGNTAGQWDQSNLSFIHITDSLGCLRLNQPQSVEILAGPNFDCTDMLGTGPYVDVLQGQLLFTNSYIGLSHDNSVGIHMGPNATGVKVADSFFEYGGKTGSTMINADNGNVSSSNQYLTVLNSAFQIGDNGNKAIDARVLGTTTIEGLRGTWGGAIINDATLPIEVDRNSFISTYRSQLIYSGNTEIFPNSVAVPFPVEWIPTIGAGVEVRTPAFAGTTLPPICSNGMVGVDTDAATGKQIYACESGSWVLQGDGSVATNLDGLTDVAISAPAVGASLKYNGTNFVNGAIDLADSDAVAGVLPDANVAATIARDAEVAAAFQPLDADLTDLADGVLTFSKVGGGTINRCVRFDAGGLLSAAAADCGSGGGGGATVLDDLTDVVITTPATGATLKYNGAAWINGPLDLADLDAVTGVLADGNVADNITAANYLPLAGGTITGNVNLGSGVTLTAQTGATIASSGGSIIATAMAGSFSIDDNDLAVSAVDGGTGGEIEDGTLTAADLGTGSLTAADAAADLATQAELDALTLPASGQTGNRIVKSTGTAGDLVESGITVDGSNNVSGAANVTATGTIAAPVISASQPTGTNVPTLVFTEGATDGVNTVTIQGPTGGFAADRTCTLQDDATPLDNCVSGGAGGGAPTDASYFVNAANASLSAEVVAGTGVATAFAINIGTTGSLVTNGGALGTPSSGNASNLTNIPAANVTGNLDLATGTIRGAVSIESTTSTGHTLAAARGQWLFADETGTTTISLPVLSTGASVCVYPQTDQQVVIDPNGSQIIVLNGTPLTGGNKIASPVAGGNAGNFACLLSNGSSWFVLGKAGTWTDGGP